MVKLAKNTKIRLIALKKHKRNKAKHVERRMLKELRKQEKQDKHSSKDGARKELE
jgi:hypothetical protein